MYAPLKCFDMLAQVLLPDSDAKAARIIRDTDSQPVYLFCYHVVLCPLQVFPVRRLTALPSWQYD